MSDHRSPSSTPVSCDYYPLWVGRLSISGVAMSHGVARVSSCCGTVHHLLWLCCHRVVARLCRYCGWTLLLLWLCGMSIFCVHVYVLSRTPLSTFSRTPYSSFLLLLFLVLRTPLPSLSRTRVCILTSIHDVTMTHTLRHFHVRLFHFDRGHFLTFSLFHFLLFWLGHCQCSCAHFCRLWRCSRPHCYSALSVSPVSPLLCPWLTCALTEWVLATCDLLSWPPSESTVAAPTDSLTSLFVVYISFISSLTPLHPPPLPLWMLSSLFASIIHTYVILWYDMYTMEWTRDMSSRMTLDNHRYETMLNKTLPCSILDTYTWYLTFFHMSHHSETISYSILDETRQYLTIIGIRLESMRLDHTSYLTVLDHTWHASILDHRQCLRRVHTWHSILADTWSHSILDTRYLILDNIWQYSIFNTGYSMLLYETRYSMILDTRYSILDNH